MDISDVLFLHPPSVMDFRERAIFYGPVSDLIPSSPVFEMYPLGFLTLTEALSRAGYRARIVNLALRMMRSRAFNVQHFLSRQKTRLIGIDLHWLPHCHGAIGLAALCKQTHPDVPILFGGLSSTYYHEELIRYPFVDMVLRGNATESAMVKLMDILRDGGDLSTVPGLTWKRGDQVIINSSRESEQPVMDLTDIAPERMIEMVIRYRDLVSVLPFDGWWKNPITAIFTVKGCSQQCLTCGSSAEACQRLGFKAFPRFRSPEGLAADVARVGRITRGPIFLVGDLTRAGMDRALRAVELIGTTHVKNEIVFEFFDMPPNVFIEALDQHIPNYSIELSPESHDEAIRREQDRSIFYTNQRMEEVIEKALSSRCHRVDVFFMVGLKGQTSASVSETVEYCGRLFARFDKRLSCFISPMGPFLDPGSSIFEKPEEHGFKTFARSLEEHRQLWEEDSWERILNYETRWMTRADMVDAVYAAAARLNDLKEMYGRLPSKKAAWVRARIERAVVLRDHLRKADGAAAEVRAKLRGEVKEFSVSTVCDKRELYWNRHLVNFHWFQVAKVVARAILKQLTNVFITRA